MDRLSTARAAYDRGDFSGALQLLSALADGSADADYLFLLAQTLARLNAHAEAAEMFLEAASRMGIEAPQALRLAAEQFFRGGNEDQAQLIALRLLNTTPDDPLLSFILISIFEKSGETQLIDALKNRLVKSEEPEYLLLALRLISGDGLNRNNLELFGKLHRLFPDDPYIHMSYLDFARSFCAFDIIREEESRLRARFSAGDFRMLAAEEPHYAIMWLETDALVRHAANFGSLKPFTAQSQARRRQMPHVFGEKIRIGYLSADFWDDHATMRLLGDVLRQHDRSRFDITLYCNTPPRFVAFDKGGRAGWGRIRSIRDLDDAAATEMIRADGIDILVDLKGHTADNRTGVINSPAAPVTVAWLGFPGSSVGVDCDYIIGDRFVTPEGAQPDFHEQICRLPETYQPNDPVTRAKPRGARRADFGLPEDVFLFASFNATRKLSLVTLDLWSRVLKAAPQAHLWIMGPEQELRDYFAAAGIAANRLHFAAKTAYDRHMDRTPLADLGLDTFPCNGHTTTSDMLWAGIPVVTMRGQSFAARVSESLLHAIGLQDMVAEDPESFVALAAGLANDPAQCRAIRQRIAVNRETAPLFNAERFCRHLERAFEMMTDRARKGEPPKAFDVPALPASSQ